ncbi:MAG TPA: hypothetical protein PK595_02100 [Bacteroidota bacterium]|nr:hypothetical protein [Bacteroidota bacterium]
MKNPLQQIDVKKIAGVKKILGINFDEHRARIVEVQQSIKYSKKNASTYKALNSFTVNFNENSSWSEKGEAIKVALAQRGITTPYAVTSIQSLGIKIVEVNIPPGTQDFDEWIMENQEKLLKYTNSSAKIVYVYKILEETDQGYRTEICFVRQEQIENYTIALEKAGLKILFMDVGISDALYALEVEKNALNVKLEKTIFVYVQEHQFIIMKIQNGKRISLSVQDAPENSNISDELSNILPNEDDVEVILTGDVVQTQSYRVLNPLGCTPEYALAVGLAIRGFSSSANEKSLLPDSEREQLETSLMKSVFQRVTILLGSIVLLALLLQYVTDYIITSKMEGMEEQLLQNGSSYAEVQLLEKQVQELKQQLQGKGALVKSSQYAKFLHDIAAAIPEGSWLYRLKGGENTNGSSAFSLCGYAENTEKVTELLRSLYEKKFDVKLIRSGNQLPAESLVPIPSGKKFITFEIQVSYRSIE